MSDTMKIIRHSSSWSLCRHVSIPGYYSYEIMFTFSRVTERCIIYFSKTLAKSQRSFFENCIVIWVDHYTIFKEFCISALIKWFMSWEFESWFNRFLPLRFLVIRFCYFFKCVSKFIFIFLRVRCVVQLRIKWFS